jgi:hypothetical protein
MCNSSQRACKRSKLSSSWTHDGRTSESLSQQGVINEEMGAGQLPAGVPNNRHKVRGACDVVISRGTSASKRERERERRQRGRCSRHPKKRVEKQCEYARSKTKAETTEWERNQKERSSSKKKKHNNRTVANQRLTEKHTYTHTHTHTYTQTYTHTQTQTQTQTDTQTPQ